VISCSTCLLLGLGFGCSGLLLGLISWFGSHPAADSRLDKPEVNSLDDEADTGAATSTAPRRGNQQSDSSVQELTFSMRRLGDRMRPWELATVTRCL
jgi:hypothetical protein